MNMANKKKITREPRRASCGPDIYKAHQAIAVLPATGSRITLLTRRFFNVLLQHAQQQGGGETYRVPFDQILQGAGYGSANFEVAKNTLRSMAKTTVEWSIVREDGADEGERRWGVSALLADAELIEVGRRLFLEWSYSPKIRQHLLDPTRYMQLSLQIYTTLRSGTAAALYEVCLRYVTNARGLTNKAEWEWWRPRLTGIPDADEAQSSAYKYFKRDTLMPAILEINTLTDIEVKLQEFKTGRKITHIQFSSSKKIQIALDVDSQKTIVDDKLLARIQAFGISDAIAAKIYSSSDEETLRLTVGYVEIRVSKGGVDSPAALFRDALKKGYGKTESKKIQDKEQTLAKARKASEDAQKVKEEPAMAKNWQSAKTYIASLNPEQTLDLEKRFAASLNKDGLTYGYYNKQGLKSRVVQAEMVKYVQNTVLYGQPPSEALNLAAPVDLD